MRANDKMKAYGYNYIKPKKLKGYVKMTLRDEFRTRVIEGENIVTDAIGDILANNYLSALNLGSMLPLCEKWFGGVLAFKNAFSTVVIDGNTVPDPTAYYPQGENINQCIAHAGNTAPATAAIVAQDYKRGSPVGVTKTANSIKYTWQFLPSQGNGIINALALTHVDVGNAGLGSTSDAFKALNPFASIGNLSQAAVSLSAPDNAFCQYDDSHSLWFHVGDEDEYYTGHTIFQTKKLTVIKRKLPYNKDGLHDLMIADPNYPESFVVTLTGFDLYCQPSYYFDYTNKKLWIFSNTTGLPDYNADPTLVYKYSKTTVNYAVIDCEAQTIDSEGTIVSDDSDLAPVSMEKYAQTSFYYDPSVMRNANIIKDGNYVWLPMSDGADGGNGSSRISKYNVKGFKVINISNQSDQSVVSFNEVQEQFKSSMKCGGLIINSGRVVNGGVGYTCASQMENTEIVPCYAFHEPYKASSVATYVGSGKREQGSGNYDRFIMAPKFTLSTKWNCPSEVEKLGTESMTIEYTLVES